MSVPVLTLAVMSTTTPRPYPGDGRPAPPGGDGGLVRPDAQVLAEAAAAAAGAADLMTAWTSALVVLSMTVEAQCEASALAAGRAVARALGGEAAAALEAAEMLASHW